MFENKQNLKKFPRSQAITYLKACQWRQPRPSPGQDPINYAFRLPKLQCNQCIFQINSHPSTNSKAHMGWCSGLLEKLASLLCCSVSLFGLMLWKSLAVPALPQLFASACQSLWWVVLALKLRRLKVSALCPSHWSLAATILNRWLRRTMGRACGPLQA